MIERQFAPPAGVAVLMSGHSGGYLLSTRGIVIIASAAAGSHGF